jgi:LmbE family N-acetylglucosaminyl deacetylase
MAGILIVAPHADDETLGCGGFAYKHQATPIHWFVCSKEDKPIKNVALFYKFDSVTELNLPDGLFDTCFFNEIVEQVAAVIHRIKPETIFMPYLYDIHSDHRVIALAVLAVCKPFRAPFIKAIYQYEVLSQTNLALKTFEPNTFCDITDVIERKKEAIRMYGSDGIPGARSEAEIEALATYRGTWIGVKYAEAFQVVRRTI